MDMFAAMGANPQQINWGEVYLALQSGVVDGQENPLANIYAAKLYEVQRFISFTNHKYEATGLMMSRAAWGRLSESDRKLFQEAAADAGAYQRKAMAESEESLVAEFKKMPTIQMNSVDTAPFKKATEVVWDEWERSHLATSSGSFVEREYNACGAYTVCSKAHHGLVACRTRRECGGLANAIGVGSQICRRFNRVGLQGSSAGNGSRAACPAQPGCRAALLLSVWVWVCP